MNPLPMPTGLSVDGRQRRTVMPVAAPGGSLLALCAEFRSRWRAQFQIGVGPRATKSDCDLIELMRLEFHMNKTDDRKIVWLATDARN